MMSCFFNATCKRFAIIALLFVVAGCASTTIKTTDVTPVIQETKELANHELLDIGVLTFNTGLDLVADRDDDDLVFEEVRAAESRFFPSILVNSLQQSAAWGAVRIIPSTDSMVDVFVQGTIIQSDGESLRLNIVASDSTGREWYNKDYEDTASRYSYQTKRRQLVTKEPFQNLYNRIANDLITYRQNLTAQQTTNIRQVSEIRFAQAFAPSKFNGYLSQNNQGQYQVLKLPADNDPMLGRIRQIRERDYLFIDTLQEYYDTFAIEMQTPYQMWRQESYQEVLALKSAKRSARNSKITGLVSVLAGIVAAGNSSSGVARAAGSVAIAAGGYIAKAGFDKDSASQIHVEALQELGDSLEASIVPHVIELEDRTVTLTGTVENQFQQWRKILKDIYLLEYGDSVTQL